MTNEIEKLQGHIDELRGRVEALERGANIQLNTGSVYVCPTCNRPHDVVVSFSTPFNYGTVPVTGAITSWPIVDTSTGITKR